jgi:hypothetical protein
LSGPSPVVRLTAQRVLKLALWGGSYCPCLLLRPDEISTAIFRFPRTLYPQPLNWFYA